MTTTVRRTIIAGSLLATLAIAPNPLHGQSSGRGGRGAPPAASRPAAAASATTVPDHIAEDLEAQYQQMASVLQKPVPKRDYKVEIVELLIKTKLFRADPKLLEKRFVARFSLVTLDGKLAESDRPTYLGLTSIRQTDSRMAAGGRAFGTGSGLSGYPAELVPLISWDGRQLFLTGSNINDRESIQLIDHHKRLLEKCAAENRPSEAMKEF